MAQQIRNEECGVKLLPARSEGVVEEGGVLHQPKPSPFMKNTTVSVIGSRITERKNVSMSLLLS